VQKTTDGDDDEEQKGEDAGEDSEEARRKVNMKAIDEFYPDDYVAK
jgi:hypothetical protein